MTEERINAFVSLGNYLKQSEDLNNIIEQAYLKNTWFNPKECRSALNAWAKLLERTEIEHWLSNYKLEEQSSKNVGLILAGNIPIVGFHDICSVLMTGHIANIKLSSNDDVLIPHLLTKLTEFNPLMKHQIVYVDRLNSVDAVIATGSNNSSRYFEYYFNNKPNIIRKNRNSVAILKGNESKDDFLKLGEDIFSYYGQGCRNVSKLFVPNDYDFIPLLDSLESFNYIADQSKYFNNYNYYKSIYLVNREQHLDTGFLLLKESDSMQAPLSVLYYEYYSDGANLKAKLDSLHESIQCIVSAEKFDSKNQMVNFGGSQQPGWMDYADGVDTISFLIRL